MTPNDGRKVVARTGHPLAIQWGSFGESYLGVVEVCGCVRYQRWLGDGRKSGEQVLPCEEHRPAPDPLPPAHIKIG
jgi:hypothetical protein